MVGITDERRIRDALTHITNGLRALYLLTAAGIDDAAREVEDKRFRDKLAAAERETAAIRVRGDAKRAAREDEAGDDPGENEEGAQP